MRETWRQARTIFLASLISLWQYRAVLLIPGLVVVAIDFASLQDALSFLVPVLQLLSLGLLITIGVSMHRAILLGDSKINLAWGMREIRYIIVLLGLLAAGFFVFALLQYIALNLMISFFLPKEFPPPLNLDVTQYDAPQGLKDRFSDLLIASSVVGLAAPALLFTRFYMLLPIAAVDQEVDIGKAWKHSRSLQYPVFCLLLIGIMLFLPMGIYVENQLLAPLMLALAFTLQVLIFIGFTVAYHLIEEDLHGDE